MTPLRPHREGVNDGGHSLLDPHGRVPKHELKLGNAKSLKDLLPDYALFTPAILYLHGGFTDAPLADLVHAVPGLKFYYKKFTYPMFQGLDAVNGNRDWNFALWLIERPLWKAVEDWMISITLAYSEDGEVAGIGLQPLNVIDALAVHHDAGLWTSPLDVPVMAFGLNGSKVKLGFDVSFDPPKLRAFPPGKTMRAFAHALYEGENPVNVRTQRRAGNEG